MMTIIRPPLIFILFATLCLPVVTTAQETTATVPAVPAVETVDINTADVATLDRVLDGIGEKKAQAIVDWREKHGSFKTVYDLEQISGIGPKTIEKNKHRIVISDPSVATDAATTQAPTAGDNTDSCKTNCNKTEANKTDNATTNNSTTDSSTTTDSGTDKKTGDN